ncbi:hypothetical protein CLV24_12278 [Pontibacter ummariensis]|uniref:Uncharacterized protein n=1 Tax=Pontibacter ummariensis TaxID=1610492 RepID=A0A239JM36_9BACT|nr:hypothetical protein [Pontibacter ummariensis]PRY07887.1 hypothetical protein CLV24_12278 [Pontibacter ummariensis]SNT06895.1 hypothetical protein SAMN06296052_12278 [Pontibacter ummariensis]
MSDKNKNNDKERLQKQSEENVLSKVENKRQQEGYNKEVQIDPAKKILQTDDSKVQNPNRNLAQGGNNMPFDKK